MMELMTEADGRVDLWSTRCFRFNRAEQEEQQKLRNLMRESKTSLGAYLAELGTSKAAGPFTREDLAALQKIVGGKSPNHENARRRLRMMANVIWHANRLYQAGIPSPPLNDREVPNPYAESPTAHKECDAWLQAEKKWIRHLTPNLSGDDHADAVRNVPVALFVLSAALHGGILNVDMVVALVATLQSPNQTFACSQERAYVDLTLAWKGKPSQEQRRWYISAKLRCLITRISENSLRGIAQQGQGSTPEGSRRKLAKAICAELREGLRTHMPSAPRPRSLQQLFGSIHIMLQSELPGCFADYCTREVTSRSLALSSLARIYGEPSLCAATEPGSSDRSLLEGESTDYAEAYAKPLPRRHEAPWIAELRRILAQEDRSQIRRELRRVMATLSSERSQQSLICRFALSLMEGETSYGSHLHPSSVRCCTLTIVRHLLPALEDKDPAVLDATTRETYYLEVLEQAANRSTSPTRMIRTVGWALREFQRFLVATCGATPIDEAAVCSLPGGLLPVDARVVSLEDMYAAVGYAAKEPGLGSARLRHAVQVQMILGFFAGLRRMEGLGLRICDCPGGMLFPIFVRNWKDRRLKTPNAIRWIPMGLFAPKYFVEIVRSWVFSQMAEQDGSATHAKLFSRLSDDMVIPIIHKALRAVTGDDTLHFHVLRHSFGTWTFLRLALTDLEAVPVLFPHLPETMIWLRESHTFRRELYGNATVTNDHAWATADLLGHGSPAVSFRHYIHCLDILLPCLIERHPVLGNTRFRDLVVASGLPENTAYDRLRGLERKISSGKSGEPTRSEESARAPGELCRNGFEPIIVPDREREILIGNQFAQSIFMERLGRVKQIPPAEVPAKHDRSWMELTEACLEGCLERAEQASSVADYLQMPVGTIDGILSRLRRVNAFLGPVATGRTGLHLGSVVLADGTTMHFPVCPRGLAAKEFVHRTGAMVKAALRLDSVRVSRALRLCLEAMQAVPGLVVFTEPNRGRMSDYLWLCKRLGVRRSNIVFELVGGAAGIGKPSAKLPRTWGLSRRDHVRNRPIPPHSHEDSLRLLVRTLHPPKTLNVELAAFRYVLIMAILRFAE